MQRTNSHYAIGTSLIAIRLSRIYRKLKKYLAHPDQPYLVQSVEAGKLLICVGEEIIDGFDASTSRFGIGIREDSSKTPPGVHRIVEKIGSGAPLGRIFRDRIDTGIDWDGNLSEENLILTRILRLVGLEEGINKGPGVDSFERYIYIHGTSREDMIPAPLSHGCIVMRSHDIVDLYDMVKEGTILYIDPPPLIVCGVPCRTIHFVGIFGTGMSALAQYVRFLGIDVSGSDRLLTSDDTALMQRSLESLGCTVYGQNGSGVSENTDAVCISTAIEETNPDIAAARTYGVPIVHRSDVLAAIVASKRTIAVAGTSGKSTVTAMIFEFLSGCGKSPSLISGAPLVRLEKEALIENEALIGNAYSGASDLLVVEADESDGTIVKYAPEMAVILNISKDHKGIDEIESLFDILISQSGWIASNDDDPLLATLPATVRFGLNGTASWHPDRYELNKTSVTLIRKGTTYKLPIPGKHNLENLCAALCVCEHCGCMGQDLWAAVQNFEGVARRFTRYKTEMGVIIVDDYAHNPAKIAAAMTAARGLSDRIIAVYQPHGFGPTRFLKDEYITTFQTIFTKTDVLYLLPIYYAGGTANKDISSKDLIDGLGSVPFKAEALKDRPELLEKLKTVAAKGDCILVMGARDPSLPGLIERIVELFCDKI
jgi:UDP-N-acetylmuramate--alanine ligase